MSVHAATAAGAVVVFMAIAVAAAAVVVVVFPRVKGIIERAMTVLVPGVCNYTRRHIAVRSSQRAVFMCCYGHSHCFRAQT